MLLQAALNGDRAPGDHPRLPITAGQLAADAAACVAAGAESIHMHPRDAAGRETLAASVVDDAVRAVRAATGVPVGVSTGAWIEPDPVARARRVGAWREPDFASVNLSEPGAVEVMRALLESEIGIEAGVWSPGDAALLAESGLGSRVERLLVEVIDPADWEALPAARRIHEAIGRRALAAPRLQHGENRGVWELIADAGARGFATRVGFEDTLYRPDGAPAASNAELVAAAAALLGRGS